MLLEAITHIVTRAILIGLSSAAAFILLDSLAEVLSNTHF